MKRSVAPDPLTFKSQERWEAWLEENTGSSPGVWLRLAKRSAPQATLSYAHALESALCYGWIDGQKRAESEDYWLQRFSPRTKSSIWSKINKEKAEALMRAGRMRPSGIRAISLAKQDGRWERAYASASRSTIPADLAQALAANRRAKESFAKLNSKNRYGILFRIQNAKTTATRAKKIAQFVEMLSNGEKLYP